MAGYLYQGYNDTIVVILVIDMVQGWLHKVYEILGGHFMASTHDIQAFGNAAHLN